MIRRLSALIGIGLLAAIVLLLIWTVHIHRASTLAPQPGSDFEAVSYSLSTHAIGAFHDY